MLLRIGYGYDVRCVCSCLESNQDLLPTGTGPVFGDRDRSVSEGTCHPGGDGHELGTRSVRSAWRDGDRTVATSPPHLHGGGQVEDAGRAPHPRRYAGVRWRASQRTNASSPSAVIRHTRASAPRFVGRFSGAPITNPNWHNSNRRFPAESPRNPLIAS